jgi:hypothetical protein
MKQRGHITAARLSINLACRAIKPNQTKSNLPEGKNAEKEGFQ